jgi:hypothetical protein
MGDIDGYGRPDGSTAKPDQSGPSLRAAPDCRHRLQSAVLRRLFARPPVMTGYVWFLEIVRKENARFMAPIDGKIDG